MNNRQKLEEKVLNDLMFGENSYGKGPEYKEKVKQYFKSLREEASKGGGVTSPGGFIPCTTEMVEHLARRYS